MTLILKMIEKCTLAEFPILGLPHVKENLGDSPLSFALTHLFNCTYLFKVAIFIH